MTSHSKFSLAQANAEFLSSLIFNLVPVGLVYYFLGFDIALLFAICWIESAFTATVIDLVNQNRQYNASLNNG